jgi:hypothetical protein
VSAVFNGSFASRTDANDVGLYNVGATASVPVFIPGLDVSGIEGNILYHSIGRDGGDAYNFGGSLYAGGTGGKVVATYNYHKDQSEIANLFGVGGVWYVAPNFDLSVKGGAIANGDASGGYVGTEAKWFVSPDFAISADVNYLSFSPNTTFGGVQAEWLVDESLPISVYGGYQRAKPSGDDAEMINVFYLGLKFYTNTGAAKGSTLVARQHATTGGFITQSPIYYDQY